MRNFDQERYAFLAHYNVKGAKRPHGLRYKTKHHVGDPIYQPKGRRVSDGVSDDVGDWVKKARHRKWITNATRGLNKSVSDDVSEFYKNKAKGESNDSLRLKRIAQVRATEAMAPVAAAQSKLFKKKKKKNAFINNTFVKPALEARKPENQAAHIVRKATKKATEKTTNPFVNGNMRKSMEKQIEKAKKKPSNAINTGIKASGSNFISDTRKSMEKMVDNAKSNHATAVAARRAHATAWGSVYNAPGSPKKAAHKALLPIKDAPDTQPAAYLTGKVINKKAYAEAKLKEFEDKAPDWYKKAKKKK